MGKKVLSDMHGASPEQASGSLLYIYGPSVPLLPSLLSLWHDPRTLGKEKRMAPLWSGP